MRSDSACRAWPHVDDAAATTSPTLTVFWLNRHGHGHGDRPYCQHHIARCAISVTRENGEAKPAQGPILRPSRHPKRTLVDTPCWSTHLGERVWARALIARSHV